MSEAAGASAGQAHGGGAGHTHDDLVPLEDARAWILDRCAPLPVRTVPLAAAAGLVLATDVDARLSVPPFANTAMDGYAVIAADTHGAPVELEVLGTLAAGAAAHYEVTPGRAVRIMTGAAIPPGADSVVMVEVTEPLDGGRRVRIAEAATAGQHVRRAGEDVAAGARVLDGGTPLGPAELGLLAATGADEIAVHPRATVGVLSTGDELVDAGVALAPGQIRDSNRRSLLAMVEEAGAAPVDLGIVGDDAERLDAALTDAVRRCDALVTSGGVSVGDFDLVRVVLDRRGAMRWMQVAIRPAKPLAFGVVDGMPVFGLPGNPVSSIVSFECFARPALRQMAGHRVIDRPRLAGVADEDLHRRPDRRVELQRVEARFDASGRLRVRSAGGQGSHQLHAMVAANALAVLPAGTTGVPAGHEVDLLLLELAGLNR